MKTLNNSDIKTQQAKKIVLHFEKGSEFVMGGKRSTYKLRDIHILSIKQDSVCDYLIKYYTHDKNEYYYLQVSPSRMVWHKD